jgi:hypothetical protein
LEDSYDITEAFVQVIDVFCSICRISWEMEAKPWRWREIIIDSSAE